MSKSGKLIVVVAPSGSGKSTLIKRLKRDFPNLEESVSTTTRPKRSGERHGEAYFFVDREDFISMRDKGEFLEWAEVHGNFYGTSKRFVEGRLATGKDLLFDLDVQGVDNMKEVFGERAHAIFIAPPSIDELETRLRGRGTEDEEVIRLRIENAKRELLRQHDYDYRVVNDELENAYRNLKAVINEILAK